MRLWLSVRGVSNWRMGVASTSFEILPPHDLLAASRRRWQPPYCVSPPDWICVPPRRSVLVMKRWSQYFLPACLSYVSYFSIFSLSLSLCNFIYSSKSLSFLHPLRFSWFLYFVIVNKFVRRELSYTDMQTDTETSRIYMQKHCYEATMFGNTWLQCYLDWNCILHHFRCVHRTVAKRDC
jgi:hypothetical protein